MVTQPATVLYVKSAMGSAAGLQARLHLECNGWQRASATAWQCSTSGQTYMVSNALRNSLGGDEDMGKILALEDYWLFLKKKGDSKE
jgi:hypothetical protein